MKAKRSAEDLLFSSVEEVCKQVNEICNNEIIHVYIKLPNKVWNKNYTQGNTELTSSFSSFVDHVVAIRDYIEVIDLFKQTHIENPKVLFGDRVIKRFIGRPLITTEGGLVGVINFFSTTPNVIEKHQRALIDLLARNITSLIMNYQISNKLLESEKHFNEFIYCASHDLKSPVNAFDHISSWLEEDSNQGIDGNYERYFSMMRKNVIRMNYILGDIKRYADVQHDDNNVDKINLNDVITQISSTIEIPTTFSVAVSSFEFLFSKPTILKILRQILSNAIKHHNGKNGRINIAGKSDTNGFEISIIDNGPGIPHKFRTQVIKPFKTLQSKDESEGSGLGLAIVEKLLTLSNGTLTFYDVEDGSGTHAKIFFPTLKKMNTCPSLIDKDHSQ